MLTTPLCRTTLRSLASSCARRPSCITALPPPRPFAVARSITSMSATPYKSVSTDKAPSAIGPYCQATVHNGTIYCSGNIPFDPSTMQCVEGGVEAQAQQAMTNLLNVVEAAGGDKSTILKTTVFLKSMDDFAKVNAVYEKNLAPYKPARSAVEVARLPRDVLVEVECIAVVKA